jgi:hypothetical protein
MLWVKGLSFENAYLPIPHALHVDTKSLITVLQSAAAETDAEKTVT